MKYSNYLYVYIQMQEEHKKCGVIDGWPGMYWLEIYDSGGFKESPEIFNSTIAKSELLLKQSASTREQTKVYNHLIKEFGLSQDKDKEKRKNALEEKVKLLSKELFEKYDNHIGLNRAALYRMKDKF